MFVQMLRSGVVNTRGWACPKPQTVSSHRQVETVDSDGEAAPAPGYRQSFSDAIAAALQNASLNQGPVNFLILFGYSVFKMPQDDMWKNLYTYITIALNNPTSNR